MVRWSHIGLLTHLPVAGHCNTALLFFISNSVSQWNDLGDSDFDGMGLAGLKSRANAFFFVAVSCFFSFCLLLLSISLLFIFIGL